MGYHMGHQTTTTALRSWVALAAISFAAGYVASLGFSGHSVLQPTTGILAIMGDLSLVATMIVWHLDYAKRATSV